MYGRNSAARRWSPLRAPRALIGLTAAFVLSLCGLALADALGPINFESGYTDGNINGQNGWSKTGAYDATVVDPSGYPASAGYGFGSHALQLSDATTSGSFGDQLISPGVANEAGETSADSGGQSGGTRQRHYEASFSVGSSQTTQQSNLNFSVSPDRGDGSRMSYLRFENQADGIHVLFDDVSDPGPVGTTADFQETDIGTLAYGQAHTAKFSINFVDGPGNDVVKIFLDGALAATGTTWEDYYRYDPEQAGNGNKVPTVDGLIFPVRGTADAGNLNKGYLLDDVSVSTSTPTTVTVNDDATGPGPTGADCADPDFPTIQQAIDGVPAGSTILVCAGTYTGGADVTKQLTLVGAQAGVDARTRSVPLGDEAALTGNGIAVGANGVSIDGFLVTDSADVAPWAGSGVQMESTTGNTRVLNTIFRDNVRGMYLTDNAPGQTAVRHNLFDSNNAAGPAGGNGIYADFGIHGASIDQNKFTGNENGAMVLTGVTPGANSNVSVTGNEVTDDQGITAVVTDNLTVAGNTITNVSTPLSGGPFSAIHLAGGVSGATISGNTVSGASSAVRITNAFDSTPNEDVTVTGNNLIDNTDAAFGYGIRVDSGGYSGLLQAHFNRIVGNGAAGVRGDGALIDASDNWWGCNAGPGQTGCDAVAGSGVDTNPWLVLGLGASATTIYQDNGQAQLTASLTRNSAGDVAGSGFPDNVAVAFAASPLGSVSPASDVTDAGNAQSLLSAGGTTGTTNATATLDNETVSLPIDIVQAPQGPTGPTGPTGSQGEPGATGPAGGVAGAVGTSKKKKKKCKKIRNKTKRKKCIKKHKKHG